MHHLSSLFYYFLFSVSLINIFIKGSLSRSKNENKLYKDLYCTLEREVLIRFIQRNQGHTDSMMHEFSSSVNKVNKAVAKVRTIGDRLPLNINSKQFKLSFQNATKYGVNVF